MKRLFATARGAQGKPSCVETLWAMGKMGGSIIGGFIIHRLGGLDKLLSVLLFLLALDYLAGILKAISTRTLSSKTGATGIARKIGKLAVVALAFVIEELIGGAFPLREVAILFFITNEGISILENLGEMGVPIPQKIVKVLQQIDPEKPTEETPYGPTE